MIENLTLIEYAGRSSTLVWNEGGEIHWVAGDDGAMRDLLDYIGLHAEHYRISMDGERIHAASTNRKKCDPTAYASLLWSRENA